MSAGSPQDAAPGPEVATTVRRPDDVEAPTMPSASGVFVPLALAPGRILADRYTVLGFLGQGGMGMVLAAYDARLDRRVALKLLRHRPDGSSGGEEQARLVREAQAMARLNHPNVVAVYDSGTLDDGSLFIAMEFVEGQTLRQWCLQERRPWHRVLAIFLEAGRGLAAAHAAGLIHRDFKPDNVLVGKDGRARVMDFGLARARPSRSLPTSAAPDADTPEINLADGLTIAGSLVGTPRYMAPELLLDGQPADIHSDVFAFCAALYEALYGQPPFAGDTLWALVAAHTAGGVKPPPPTSEVPAWVTRTVLGGLHRDPSQRPATIEAVLAALEHDPRARRRAWLLAAGLAIVVALLGGLVASSLLAPEVDPCAHMDRQLADVWDPATRGRVEQALLATGVPYAADTAGRVSAALDGYADAWVTMRTEVCELAGPALRGQASSLVALRESCLERRRSRLRALTELLAAGPDRAVIDQAVQAAQSLPSLDYCADVDALTAAVPPPEDPTLRARVEALEQQADRLEALYEAGKYPEGVALGEGLLRETEAVAFAPLHARVLFAMAELREPTGDYEGSKVLARQAIVAAARGKDTRLGARAWSQLLFVIGSRQGRGDEALQLSLALEAAVELADDPVVRADADNTLGIMFTTLERHEESRVRHARALALREQSLGPEHPHTMLSLSNLGRALLGLGRHEEARQALERAALVRARVLGPEHPANVFALGHLGGALLALGRHDEARANYERALALRRQAIGHEDPAINGILTGLGSTLAALGEHDEAIRILERALALREQVGVDSHQLAPILNALGRSLRQLGRYEEAQQRHARALALQEAAFGPSHASLAASLLGLGELALARGEPAQALPLLERALTLSSVEEHANVQLALAEALWVHEQERPRARALAMAAREHWRGTGHQPNLARASAWLAAHPGV